VKGNKGWLTYFFGGNMPFPSDEYVPPLRRPKANSANEDLAERLTHIGLPNA